MTPLLHKLEARHSFNKSLLCLGLDPSLEDVEKFSKKKNGDEVYNNNIHNKLVLYCKYLINETKEYLLCIKPNLAFFLQFGFEGINALKDIVEWIPKELAIILDGKFGDIDSTMLNYMKFVFEYLKVDAVTINLYMGLEVLKRAVTKTNADNGFNSVFVLASTTNPSADIVQSAIIDDTELFLHIIKQSDQFSAEATGATVGYVIGSTKPNSLIKARKITNAWFLVPGLGAQGGNLEKTIKNGIRPDGKGLILNISRGISKSENPNQTAFTLYKEIQNEVYKIKS